MNAFLKIIITSIIYIFPIFTYSQQMYKRPEKVQKEILKNLKGYWPQTIEFIKKNETLPYAPYKRVFYAEAKDQDFSVNFNSGSIDHNTLVELSNEQAFAMLEMINTPTLFEQAEPATNTISARIYFLNDDGVFFDISIFGYLCFYVDYSPFFHGLLKTKHMYKYVDWVKKIEDSQPKPNKEILNKILLYETFSVGSLCNIWGYPKRYSEESKAYGIQVFNTALVEKADSMGRALQKEFKERSINILAEYGEKGLPFYKIIISNFNNRKEAELFREQIKTRFQGAFIINQLK